MLVAPRANARISPVIAFTASTWRRIASPKAARCAPSPSSSIILA
jgi:hypothetical protein